MEEAVAYLRAVLHRALSEDIGHADITTDAIAGLLGRVKAEVIHRSGGTVAGMFCVGETLTSVCRFLGLDENFQIDNAVAEGTTAAPGEVICNIEADAALLLPSERTMLNFLARLCGVADLTSRFVKAVEGTKARIMDTRKTTPLLRPLDKYAVRTGGGMNHRFGLYDQILFKDNHLKLSKVSEEDAVRLAREYLKKHGIRAPVEIEVDSLEALARALSARADIIMLDNMPLEDLTKAVSMREEAASDTVLEVSGGVNLDNVRAIADTGIERISIGALTHSAPAADVALEFTE